MADLVESASRKPSACVASPSVEWRSARGLAVSCLATATAAAAGAHVLLGGPAAALWISACSGVLLFASILASVGKFSGAKAAAGLLWLVPRYVLWKIPLYLAYLFQRETQWKKTERIE